MAELKLYTSKEVMQILKVSKTTLYTYVRLNELKVIRIGRNVRISEDELNRFIAEGLSPEYPEKLKVYLGRDKK